MPSYFAHSVTDLVCRKNKEILVLVYSIPSIYKIQTFTNVNRQKLREKKQSHMNVTKIFQVWIGDKKQTKVILQKLYNVLPINCQIWLCT